MKWFKDEWDELFDEIVYSDEEELEEEEEEAAMYFDVPIPYRPIQIKRRNK